MGSNAYGSRRQERSALRLGRRLAAAEDPDAGRCVLPGCGRHVQTAAGNGFSQNHCTYHIQHMSRHGSFWKKTFTADHLKPYRRAADLYLAGRIRQKDTERALSGLLDLLNWKTRRIALPDLPRRSPDDKARAALWRLREAGVLPRRLLQDHLAISAAVRDEFAGGDEYRLVQIAKAASRMAGGFHRKYEWRSQWNVYQPSRGLYLRVLGALLDEACGSYTRDHLDSFLAMKRSIASRPANILRMPIK